MFLCHGCNEKKFHLFVVIIIALSQISEVCGWDWFNYWSYQLCHMMPWYKKLPWAISFAESLAYKSKRPRPYKKHHRKWRATVLPSPSTFGEKSAEGTSSFPNSAHAITELDTKRRFGPFPLDPDQQILDEETLGAVPITASTVWDVESVTQVSVLQPPEDKHYSIDSPLPASSGLTGRRLPPFFLEWLPAADAPSIEREVVSVKELPVQQPFGNSDEERSWDTPASTSTPSTPPRPAPGTRRRFGPFPLDLEHQLDEETFTI